MSKKLTPWFPGSVKPVHVGWYLVKASAHSWFDNGNGEAVKRAKRRWNGSHWQWRKEGRLRGAAFSHADMWRGLAEQPK